MSRKHWKIFGFHTYWALVGKRHSVRRNVRRFEFTDFDSILICLFKKSRILVYDSSVVVDSCPARFVAIRCSQMWQSLTTSWDFSCLLHLSSGKIREIYVKYLEKDPQQTEPHHLLVHGVFHIFSPHLPFWWSFFFPAPKKSGAMKKSGSMISVSFLPPVLANLLPCHAGR